MCKTGNWTALVTAMIVVAAVAGLARADQIDVEITPTETPHGISATFWHGQTFVPSNDFLTAVELRGLGADHGWNGGLTPGSTITATIHEANGFTGINLNLGAELGSATREVPLGPPGSGNQWNGRFELGVVDVSGRVGAAADNGVVAVFTAGGSYTGEETVWYNTGNIYAAGTAVQSNNGGSTWTWDLLGPSIDLGFRAYTDPVPEPASLAVLVGAMAMCLARRRR